LPPAAKTTWTALNVAYQLDASAKITVTTTNAAPMSAEGTSASRRSACAVAAEVSMAAS
jgi:hypothetical protein